jgi:glutathione peroxidase
MASVYDFTVRDIDGAERSLGEFRGKVLLIVNTASQCGFTYQYKGLEALHRDYADKGVEVLGFPSNQFKNQEPGDAAEIKSFCALTDRCMNAIGAPPARG